MVTMYNFLKISAFFFIATVTTGDEIDKTCFEIFDPEAPDQECCETDFDMSDQDDEDFSNCPSGFSTDEEKCDTIKCYFKHEGIWKDDELNDEVVKSKLESIDSKYPLTQKAAQRILKYCLNGKYLKYGREASCPAMKYFLCSYINTIVECDSWNKTEQCSKHSEYASKCKASIGL